MWCFGCVRARSEGLGESGGSDRVIVCVLCMLCSASGVRDCCV